MKNIEDKIHDITNLVANATLNAKITDVSSKIPNVTILATTAALAAVGNQMPDYRKYITTW